jgi:nicotinic acid mononucleotide adenylyltransferase
MKKMKIKKLTKLTKENWSNWSELLEGTKAIILNEETDEKVLIEIPKNLVIIEMLLEQISSSEDYIRNAEEGDAFDIGYEFLQQQYLELSKPFFEITENSHIEFIETSEEEKESGIYTIASLSKVD